MSAQVVPRSIANLQRIGRIQSFQIQEKLPSWIRDEYKVLHLTPGLHLHGRSVVDKLYEANSFKDNGRSVSRGSHRLRLKSIQRTSAQARRLMRCQNCCLHQRLWKRPRARHASSGKGRSAMVSLPAVSRAQSFATRKDER